LVLRSAKPSSAVTPLSRGANPIEICLHFAKMQAD
jgi:hypothetical protein